MNLPLGFALFIITMITCLVTDHTMVIALVIGLVGFVSIGIKKGYKIKELTSMGINGIKEATVVIEVMFLIGFITGIWRSAGTITYFVYNGIKLITPNLFIIITFLLCCVLSYALGTSFGVAGTAGVIFMALARSGGVDPIITAGAIISGIYFGDRGSPVSSSAILIASITHTDIYNNVRLMMRTSLLPFIITFLFYLICSFNNPILEVQTIILTNLEREFTISFWSLLPALCMIILPLIKVRVIHAMMASIMSGVLVTLVVEKMPLIKLINTCIFGFHLENEALGVILNGGGLVSMIEVVCIIIISSTYSGIFNGTKMLSELQDKVDRIINKIGRFPSTVFISLIAISVFCNQTIASMMCNDIVKKSYLEDENNSVELAIDLENSVILLSGVVPWALACSLPLKFLQVGYEAVPWAVYLFLVPICYCITKRRFFKS